MGVHTDFKFHASVAQIGVYWEGGGHTELYLLEGERLVLIDTGCKDSPTEYIAPALQAVGRDLSDIGVIINTHGHYDHAGGNAAVVAASGAEVWLAEPDVEIAEDFDRQFALYFAQNDTLVGREDRLPASRAYLDRQGSPTRVDRKLAGGERLDLGRGIELTVIPTPGHTRGCICLYWESDGIIFTGDSAPGAGSRDGGMPLLYYPEAYEQSLARLSELDFGTLCLGHHYRSLSLTRESVKYGAEARRYLGECREIAEIIAGAVQAAVRENPEADFLAMARLALPRIEQRLPLAYSADTGLPVFGPTAALHANWQRFKNA